MEESFFYDILPFNKIIKAAVFRFKRTIQRDPLKQFAWFFCWGFGAFRTHVVTITLVIIVNFVIIVTLGIIVTLVIIISLTNCIDICENESWVI